MRQLRPRMFMPLQSVTHGFPTNVVFLPMVTRTLPVVENINCQGRCQRRVQSPSVATKQRKTAETEARPSYCTVQYAVVLVTIFT